MRPSPHIHRIPIAICLAVAGFAFPHGDDGGGPASGRPAHVGTGVALMEPDDSLALTLDLFGYLGSSRAGGLRAGEPLGAGGKLPVYYNQYLYKEGPAERPHLEQPDLRPSYRDFSYIPLWQADQAELRTQYRFLPRIWGSLSLAFSDEPNQVEMEDAARAPQIEELWLKWAPERWSGTSLMLGSLDLTGGYCPIFDRFPLERTGFSGLSAAYARALRGETRMSLMAAIGSETSGRLKRTVHSKVQDLTDPLISTELDGERDRIHAVLTARWENAEGPYLAGLFEYQGLPKDSTVSMPITASVFPSRWQASHGWQVGFEAGWNGHGWNQHISAVRGKGDVRMAWSGPDAITRIDRSGWDVEWSRNGSALSQAMIWGAGKSGRLSVEWGAWGQWREPAKDSGYPYSTGRAGPDSVATLRAQDFRALRWAIDPSIRFLPGVAAGIRYDGFLYPDPQAHANTQEYLSDAALRNVPDTSSDGTPTLKLGPSPWEREAVGANILSPYLQADMGGNFHARAVWSGGWYAESVWRQGVAARFHANLGLAAWFTYAFFTHSTR